MNKTEISDRVQDIFRDVFDDEELLINDSTNSENIEDWDSLNHINLVTLIEKEFKVRFGLGEIANLNDVGEMIDLILSKI